MYTSYVGAALKLHEINTNLMPLPDVIEVANKAIDDFLKAKMLHDTKDVDYWIPMEEALKVDLRLVEEIIDKLDADVRKIMPALKLGGEWSEGHTVESCMELTENNKKSILRRIASEQILTIAHPEVGSTRGSVGEREEDFIMGGTPHSTKAKNNQDGLMNKMSPGKEKSVLENYLEGSHDSVASDDLFNIDDTDEPLETQLVVARSRSTTLHAELKKERAKVKAMKAQLAVVSPHNPELSERDDAFDRDDGSEL